MPTFSQHLTKYLDADVIDSLLASLDDHPMDAVLLNENKMTKAEFLSRFPHVSPHPVVTNGFLYDKQEYPLGRSYLFDAGVYYLQEPSAMVVAHLLPIEKGDRILDLCAAPGGKSVQASLKLQGTGLLLANDINYPRAKILSSNIERIGLSNVVVTNDDLVNFAPKYSQFFDKIILDAPCSGSGMFRKLDTMKEDWSYQKVLKYAQTQKSLIHMAYQMLAPGGIMVYSTCSYSYEENEEVILDLLASTDAKMHTIEDHPSYYRHPSLPEAIHLMSHRFPGEGHFIGLIAKPGYPSKSLTSSLPTIRIDEFSCRGYLEKKQEQLYALPMMFDSKGLTVLRYGVHLGEQIDGRFMPSHHLAHVIETERIIEVDEAQKKRYLKGETLVISSTLKGYYLVQFEGLSLGWGKAVQGILKNHYPKGLRH